MGACSQAPLTAITSATGDFLGPVIELPRLNGQAVVLLDHA
jgi:hypothetical protein